MTPADAASSPCDDPAVWCGIPVYNNAGTIADVARRCREQIARVLVIDDGSTDADLRELLRPIDVTVVRHPTNLGKGAALLTAFQYAAERGAQYLITLDGDGQHFPEDIPRFISRLSPDTLLIGQRSEISGDMPQSSEFGRQFSDFWISVESGQRPSDTQSGFRAYPLQACLALPLNARRYHFEVEVVTKAIWGGMRTEAVPIRVWYPPVGERISSFHPFRDNLRISLLHARLILRQLLPIPHRKLERNGGYLGVGVDSLSAGIGANFDGRPPPQPSPAVAEEGEGCYGVKSALPAPGTPGEGQGGGRFVKAAPFRQGNSPNLFQMLCFQNSTPLGLAISTGLSILLGILLGGYGILPIAYLTVRLHLNKIIALIAFGLCMAPPIGALSLRIGHAMLRLSMRPGLERFVGAHVVAFPAAVIGAWLVLRIARRLQPNVLV